MFELIFLGVNSSIGATPITINDYQKFSNFNSMPPVITYSKPEPSYSIAKSVFPDMRSFNEKEKQEYLTAINKVYTPVSDKLF